jgi:hypothetical protein
MVVGTDPTAKRGYASFVFGLNLDEPKKYPTEENMIWVKNRSVIQFIFEGRLW